VLRTLALNHISDCPIRNAQASGQVPALVHSHRQQPRESDRCDKKSWEVHALENAQLTSP